MPSVAFHYDTEGWAYHHRCKALAKYVPDDFIASISSGRAPDRRDRCDLALQLCYSQVRYLRKMYRKAKIRPKMVAGMNVGYTDRNAEYLKAALRDADHVVINSKLMYDRVGQPENATWISNGIDRDIFRVSNSLAERSPHVLWTGSVFHRKPLKGYDEFLMPLAKRLWLDGIDCDFRLANSHGGPTRRTPEEMALWYNTGTVYVCASSVEGTPNPALEAAACGCTVVSTRVGNMPELIEHGVNGFLVDRNVDALYQAVKEAVDVYDDQSRAMQQRIIEWGWDRRAKQYYDLFRCLIQGNV